MGAKTAGDFRAYEPVGIGPLTNVDTTQLYPLGLRCKAKDVGSTAYGLAEFVYLKGVTGIARGTVCLICDDYSVTKATARDIGCVCVALAAVDAATKYGWFQTRGQGVALCDTTLANKPCYVDGTAGRVDDDAVAGDAVVGMRTVTADDTNTCVVTLLDPHVGDTDNA